MGAAEGVGSMTFYPKWTRIPTAEEIASFSGMHCAYKWKTLGPTWRCPSCGRMRNELIRWSLIRGPFFKQAYGDQYGMGFTVSLTEHHCHRLEPPYRFEPTIICGDCNSADGAAKRKLRLPATWSYTPCEIGSFTTVKPFSGKTGIDYEKAWTIWQASS